MRADSEVNSKDVRFGLLSSGLFYLPTAPHPSLDLQHQAPVGAVTLFQPLQGPAPNEESVDKKRSLEFQNETTGSDQGRSISATGPFRQEVTGSETHNFKVDGKRHRVRDVSREAAFIRLETRLKHKRSMKNLDISVSELRNSAGGDGGGGASSSNTKRKRREESSRESEARPGNKSKHTVKEQTETSNEARGVPA